MSEIEIPKAAPLRHAERAEMISVADLVPYARNARTHSEHQVRLIAASIAEYGFTNPVLIDADNGIIAGHGRVLAAETLKIDTVPCLRLGWLSDTQKRAYMLADNRIPLIAGWDEDMLGLELRDLQTAEYDLKLMGFDDRELVSFLASTEPGPEVGPDGQIDYTKKIEAPIYEPKGDKPELDTLYDLSKTDTLINAIESVDVPIDIKKFLRFAATRHTVFNYERIAEYYAHAPKEVQELMEASALVIIDFRKAIENGFVALSQDIARAYHG